MNDPITAARSELAKRELCRRRLLPFVERFGPANYQTGWFHRELAAAIEEFERAIIAREAPRLMIFAPPRHGKTEIVSKAAPAWLIGRHPEWEGIVASYGDDLAIDNGGWAKDAVQSSRYKEIFPKLAIRADTASKARIETTEGGSLRFTSIGGTIVGRGMHFGVLDDPIKNREEASSEAYRQKIRSFYTGPFLSRLAPGAGILLMHQRWDEEDLAGWLLSQPNNRFKVFNFPAIAEEDSAFRKKGEALHPERWPVAELMRKKEEMSTQDWLSMYQQRPTNPTGSFFKINLINWMARESMPRLVKVYQAWDLALSPKQEADDSCGACMGVDHLGRFWLIDMVYGKWSPDETARQIIKFWLKHDAQMVWFENGPPYLGIMPSLKHEMKRQGTWIPNDEISHGGKSKDHRASAMRGLINGGNLYAPADAPWRKRFNEQAAAFPGGKNDDMCLSSRTWVLCSDGWKLITQITTSDQVWTRKGLRRVLWSGKTGVAKTISRATLAGTPSHPVWTENRGWVQMGLLNPSDSLVCVGNPWFSTDGRIIAIPTQKELPSPDTFTATPNMENHQDHYTEMCGSGRTAQLTTAGMFTIRMGRMTIVCNTLNALPLLSTASGTGIAQARKQNTNAIGQGLMSHGKVSSKSAWKESEKKNPQGKLSLKPGIKGRPPEPFLAHAQNAEQDLATRHAGESSCTAPQSAGNTQGTSCDMSQEPVYNLSIEGCHEFFANGILVHNCDPVAYLAIKSPLMMSNPDTTPLPKQLPAVERSQMVKRNYTALTASKRSVPKSRDDW